MGWLSETMVDLFSGPPVEGYGERATYPPLDFTAPHGRVFGPGVANQPTHEALMRESLGVADFATRAIANRIAGLDLLVKTTRGAGATQNDEILDDHPLKRLLDRPHPSFTREQLMRLTAQWIVTVGEAYWLKVSGGLSVPGELHPVPPHTVEPLVDKGVTRGFLVQDGEGGQHEVPADAMVRFYFPDPENPWRSEGYLAPQGPYADGMKFASQHLRAHYQFDATPRVVLEGELLAQPPPTGENAKRFADLWRRKFGNRGRGSDAGTPAFLPSGYKAHQLDMQNGQQQTPLLEFYRDHLLMAYGTPRSVLGQVISGDRSSAETNAWVFDRHTVLPVTKLMSGTLNHQLAPDFDARIFCAFEDFVSKDKTYELEKEEQDLIQGVRTINQVRHDREIEPVEWGDEPLFPMHAMAMQAEDDDDPDDPNDRPAPNSDDEDDEERSASREQAARKRKRRRRRSRKAA